MSISDELGLIHQPSSTDAVAGDEINVRTAARTAVDRHNSNSDHEADSRFGDETIGRAASSLSRTEATPDNDDSDADSGLGREISSDTESLHSDVCRHREENGRRYQSFPNATYFAPNDEEEQGRMEEQHCAKFFATGKKFYHSPLEKPRYVLDIGTGTGEWAVDMGDLYPNAEIIGVDLSPIQTAWVPLNVRFEIANVELTWTWPDDYFSLIYSSLMVLGSIRDPRCYFRQAFK
jgi:hypothetical protein